MAQRYPLKFLDAYTREDHDLFFGRQPEIEALYEMVFQADLLLLYGASGTGKTSLIQCGLANKFQPYDWMPLSIRRRDDINASLAATLDAAGGQVAADDEDDLGWLSEDLSAPEAEKTATEVRHLSPLARQLRAIYLQHFKPIYLIFDQFEELYILGNREEQAAFIRTVQDILRVEQPVKIIISIREEYLGYLYEFERAVPELLRKKLRVEPMNLEKVRTVVTSIGALADGNIRLAAGQEEQLAQGIFDKIRGQQKSLSIPLPYLQVFLDKLYLSITGDEDRVAEATFTVAALEQLGDIDDVLRDFLDEQVLRIARAQNVKPERVWGLLSPFVTLEGTKEPLAATALAERNDDLDAEQINQLLLALQKSRILRYREEADLYEVAHDSLAKQINAKRSDEEVALLEVRRLIRSQVSIKPEAREYFSGKQLDFMADFLPKLHLEREELDWIAESEAHRKKVEAAEREEQQAKLEAARKRLRNVLGLLLLAVLALVVAGYFYFDAKAQELEAQKQREAAEQQEQIAIEKTREAEEALTIAEREKQAAVLARDSVSVLFESLATETQQREAAERSKVLAEERAALNKIFDQIDGLPDGEEAIGIRRLEQLLRANTYPSSRERIRRKIRALQQKM